MAHESEGFYESLKALPLGKQAIVVGSMFVGSLVLFGYIGLVTAMFQRVFADLSGWESFGVFVLVSLVLTVMYRAFGFHHY